MTEEMKSNFIHVCFVIDESSSMWTSVEDVLSGFKKIVEEQKMNKEGECAISLFRFASTAHSADFIMKDINEVSSFLHYHPSGCTALYDGVGVAIDEIGKVLADMPEDQRPEKNLIVIMTDGEENSSREYQPSRIKEMIKHQEDKYNWTFLYIGTDITNTQDADRIGISRKMGSVRSKLVNNYNVINTVTSCYRMAKGTIEQKYATMDSCLDLNISAINAEYEADSGVKIK